MRLIKRSGRIDLYDGAEGLVKLGTGEVLSFNKAQYSNCGSKPAEGVWVTALLLEMGDVREVIALTPT